VDFFLLRCFFEVSLAQTFDARTSRNIGLALLKVRIATRVHRADIGITPPIMSRHEDNLGHFGANGTDIHLQWIERLSRTSSHSITDLFD
jgi:hypothetical protein